MRIVNTYKLTERPFEIPEEQIKTTFVPNKQQMGVRFPNILISAPKNSGKTTILFNMVKNFLIDMNNRVKIIIFSPSLEKDKALITLVNYLINNQIPFMTKPYIVETLLDGSKINHLEKLNHYLNVRNDESQELLIIYDDLTDADLRKAELFSLIRRNRHVRTTNIICSQSLKSVRPDVIQNIDIFLLMHGLNSISILSLAQKINITLSKEDFLELYKRVTKEKYSFLWLDVQNGIFKYKFNVILEIEEGD